MKKSIVLLALVFLLVLAFAGCSASEPAASASESASAPAGQEPNSWVVTSNAPVKDAQGKTVGTAFPGFAVHLQGADGGTVTFMITIMDDKGQSAKEEKTFSIDTKYMQKQYVAPQAVILMISGDMIKLNPGSSLYNAAGERLITFDNGVGPFFYIQKTDQGYMFTLDSNIVYAKEADVTVVNPS